MILKSNRTKSFESKCFMIFFVLEFWSDEGFSSPDTDDLREFQTPFVPDNSISKSRTQCTGLTKAVREGVNQSSVKEFFHSFGDHVVDFGFTLPLTVATDDIVLDWEVWRVGGWGFTIQNCSRSRICPPQDPDKIDQLQMKFDSSS
ncbi:hypothetical protein Tco_0185431 [Tanacetum coccineum]